MDRDDVPSPVPDREDLFTGDPLGLAVEQLFQASLELHGALALISHPVAGRRVHHAIERLDEAVGSIRRGVLEREPAEGGATAELGLADMISQQAGGFDPGGLTDWFGHLPTVDGVAVTMSGRRTDDLVLSARADSPREVSVAQLAAVPGPGGDARSTGRSVEVADLWGADVPWPDLPEYSRGAGLRCAYAVPIRFGDDVFGSLDLFSEQAGGLDSSAVRAADALAVAAAVGIVRHRSGHAKIEDANGLWAELGELIVFQRAAGALAARQGLTLQQAAARIAGYARDYGLCSAVVAALVLEGTESVLDDLGSRDLPEP